MDWIAGLVIVLPIVYFVMMIAHYVVLKLIVFMKWDETDWFHDMIEEETKQMNKETILKKIIPIVSMGWCIGLFFMGWQTILYTGIGIAIGVIVKQLRENVQIMTITEITNQVKNVKNSYLNDEITTEELIEGLEDIIHEVEGNDGLDGMVVATDDDFYQDFEGVDFTQLKVD